MRLPSRKSRNPERTRVPAQLTPKLDKHLLGYSAAAAASANSNRTLSAAIAIGAVGLGIASLPVAEAKVIYTPANQGFSEFNRKVLIDFNHDGIVDASLSVYGYCISGSGNRQCFGTIFARGLQGNQVMLGTQQFASAAVPGKLVGPKDQFGDSPQMANCFADFNSHSSTQRDKGPWVNVANRYLGFKFSISGQTHYAWARVSTGGFPCFPNGTLTGYAYETIPNQPIFAGVSLNPTGSPAIPEGTPAEEPKATTNQKSSGAASLGVLATGAAGLDVWRR